MQILQSDEDFDPAELKLLPVLASDRSSNQLQKETKKLQEVRGRDFGFVPRKKKLKNANASFY